MCHNCPDATIRNGMLIPVCIADHISPLDAISHSIVGESVNWPGGVANAEKRKLLWRSVYQNMGQAEPI
jgi:hypothetical protein